MRQIKGFFKGGKRKPNEKRQNKASGLTIEEDRNNEGEFKNSDGLKPVGVLAKNEDGETGGGESGNEEG